MKRAINYVFALAAGLLLFVACKNQGDVKDQGNDNPVFQTDAALKTITGNIVSHPKDASLYFRRGNMLHKLQMDSLALKDFKTAVNLDSNNSVYYSAIGDLIFENKDIAGSVSWIQKAIAKNPADEKAHLKIAKLFLYIKDYGKSFAEINIVLRADVHNPEAYFLKGMVYKDMKDTAKAISNFQTAVQEDPDYRVAVLKLAQLYSAKNDPIALSYMDKAFLMDSTDVSPLFDKAVYFQNRKDTAKAKELYTACILRNHHYADAYFNMGFLLLQQDSFQKAWRQFNLVVKNDPLNSTGYYNRGVCSELLDSVQNAIADYKIATSLDTSYKSPKIALRRLKVLK